MSDVFFTSDLHLQHKVLVELFRTQFSSVEEMDEIIIQRWNERVKNGSRVYCLGDVALGSAVTAAEKLKRLNGQIYLVRGNHDRVAEHRLCRDRFIWIKDKFGLKIGKQKIYLDHYAHRTWNCMHYGSWMLHGHCFDHKTEVLTIGGWKTRGAISLADDVATVNEAGQTEYQRPLEIIDATSSIAYELKGRNVDGLFTPNHRLAIAGHDGDASFTTADAFADKTNRRIPTCGTSPYKDYEIADDMLKLYVWMVTDGSLENANFVRFHLKKERKINRLSELLTKIGVPFSCNKQKAGTTKINFTMPLVLSGFSVKPLDNFVMKLSQRQAEIFVEEYSHTDGNKQGGRAIQISTGKECEADLLQGFLVTHGYTCNSLKRTRNLEKHGHGTYVTYILSVNSKRMWQTTQSHKAMRAVTTGDGNNEFWCLSVPNRTLIIRRNGKVHVTGNSHGSLRELDHRSFDVGVDCWNFYPVSYEEVAAKMATKKFVPVDHHTEGCEL